jgi:hypothetical protein
MPPGEVLLVAGRELDAAVAEKVMGWSDVRPYEGDSPPSAIDGMTAFVPDPLGGNCWGRRYVPKFSADIGSAWQVVERLKALGFWVSIEAPGGAGSEDDYPEVSLYRDFWMQDQATAIVKAATVPLAICCAALAVCGGKVVA